MTRAAWGGRMHGLAHARRRSLSSVCLFSLRRQRPEEGRKAEQVQSKPDSVTAPLPALQPILSCGVIAWAQPPCA